MSADSTETSVDTTTFIDQQVKAVQQKDVKDTQKIVISTLVVLVVICVAYVLMGPSQTNNAPSPQTQAVSDAELSAQRDAFKSQLSAFEGQWQPALDNTDIGNWNNNAVKELQQLKKEAIEAFAQSNYGSAVELLTSTAKGVESLSQSWDDAFKRSLTQAQSQFDAKEINRSKVSLAQALKVQPNQPDALFLQEKINRYPQMQKLHQQVNVADVEGDLPKLIKLLETITQLEPYDEVSREQLLNAKKLYHENEFQRYLNKGLHAVQVNEVTQAEAAYLSASRIYPNRNELIVLEKKISGSKQKSNLQSIHRKLHQQEIEDNWIKANQLTTHALKQYPNDITIQQYHERSKKILRLLSEGQDYLDRPQRLSDVNIQKYANQWLAQAKTLSSFSAELRTSITAVKEQISLHSILYEVTLLSDNKTHIEIKGEGAVGKVELKTIKLPRGTYFIVGTRTGFKTKQEPLLVGPSQHNQMSMVCNERI